MALKEYKATELSRQNAEQSVLNANTDFQAAQKNLVELEEKVKKKLSQTAAKRAEQARLTAQLDVLDQAEQSLAGYADGAKLLLEAARQSKIGGARGALSAAIEVPVDLEIAISAALGEFTDSILLHSGQDTERALALLAMDHSSRASILTLDWISPVEPLKPPSDSNCLGVASDLVKAPADMRPVLDLLLGQVLVVRNRSGARRLLASQPKHARVVTLAGEVFHATGEVLAGKGIKTAALGRPRQRRELLELLTEADRKIITLENETKDASLLLDQARGLESDLRKNVVLKQTLLDKALEVERQSQIWADTTQRQLDWQLNQMHSIESEIAQEKNERQQSQLALSQIEKDEVLSQDTLRIKQAELAALSLEEVQEQMVLWATRSAVGEAALGEARMRQSERKSDAERLLEQHARAEARLVEIEKSLAELEIERETQRSQVAGINSELEELRVLIGPAERTLEDSIAQELELQKKESEEQFGLGTCRTDLQPSPVGFEPKTGIPDDAATEN